MLALAIAATLTPWSPPTLAVPSDPVAVYALVTRVELRPDAQAPRTVRVHGAFAIADGKRGDYYRSPRWGSLLFHAADDERDKCLAQWRDLERVAGTSELVGFGLRYDAPAMRVQARGAETDDSVAYPTGYGLQKVRNVDYGSARALRLLPRPVAPEGEVAVRGWAYVREPQTVTLVAANCLERARGTRYVFQIERANGDVVSSPPIEEGEGETRWKVWLVAEPGERVTWRVSVVRDDVERAPVATAHFVTKAVSR